MKESDNKDQHPGKNSESEKRLAMVKTEVSFDFPGLLESLASGAQIVMIKSTKFGTSLGPDVLRRIGNVTALCNRLGVTLMFVNPDKLAEFDDA